MNIKSKKTVLTIYTLLAIFSGLGFAIYRTVLLKRYYDPYDASFEPGSGGTFRTFEYILVAVAFLMLTSAFFAQKAKFQLFSARSSTTSIAVCAICGFIFAASAVIALATYSDVIFDFSSGGVLYKFLLVAALFLMFFAALYFICCASTAWGKSHFKAYLSLVLPMFALLYLGAAYFDTTLMFQDTNRITCQVAFISVLLFLLSETNIATGQKGFAFHFAASLACIVCVSAYIIPLVSLISFWEMSISLSIEIEISSIGVLLYAIFSAFNAIRTLEEDEEAKVQAKK